MRLLQLSDIHLSSSNQSDLNVYFLNSIIDDLKSFHSEKPIDVILITGDLVDKGGESLGKSPYKIFQEKFVKPICDALSITNEQVLFIPGNHDINRNFIEEQNEFFLAQNLNKERANEELKKHKNKITPTNKRIKKFKDYEKNFHSEEINYKFSYNESMTVRQFENYKIGFVLINDSWRCSTQLKKEQHFIGTDQLKNAKLFFDENETDVNIAVFHHPLEEINSDEKEEIENFLQSFHFDIAFFGHTHSSRNESINSSTGGVTYIRGRAAFNRLDETQSKYQSGFLILDIDIAAQQYTLHARKFIEQRHSFDNDVDSMPGGKFTGRLNKPSQVPLNNDIKANIPNLPTGYSADVDKVVNLLIGKSLYPDKHIFVRELIQNSVDACKRINKKYPNTSPKITVHINTLENSFEIIDEGDGMSKKVLKDHFSIVGKSISQEFTEALSTVNLISQFGIGFISTFIVAQKIYISTKSEEDGLINFEIDDVFKGFDYSSAPSSNLLENQLTGTSVKVILKSSFPASLLLHYITMYCRHVNNLSYFFNGMLQSHERSWNLEGGIFHFEDKNSNYECKLTIGISSRPIIATNSGFLINRNPAQIVPYLFPYIIGGEVVFEPKSIDFDLSRTNIIDSEKSLEFKKAISISLRTLFERVLDAKHTELMPYVIRYLQYYLYSYDNIKDIMPDTYTFFYSKRELVRLCSEYSYFDFMNNRISLSEILIILKNQNIRVIYTYTGGSNNDLGMLISRFLSNTGNFVFYPSQVDVGFREGSQAFLISQLVSIIASEHSIYVINLDETVTQEVSKVVVDRGFIDIKINNALSKIEMLHSLNIKIARFGADYKLLLNNGFVTFINCDHVAFKDLTNNISIFSDQALELYLLGLLGCNLSSVATSNRLLSNTQITNN